MTLMSVLLAIGLAEILSGWGRLARSGKRHAIYPLFAVWSCIMVFSAVSMWTQYWNYQGISFIGYKVLLLLIPILIYVLVAHMLTPDPEREDYDMAAEYWRLAPVMFPLIALMGLVGIPVLILAAELNLEEHGQLIVGFSIATLFYAALATSLGFVKNTTYHWAITAIVLVLTVPAFSLFQITSGG